MGRKPNALIIKHFERGAKLRDSSNRYEQTCKGCGERFPKGRNDSLTSHLLNKCPAISKPDRQQARLEFSNKSDGSSHINGQHGDVQMNGATLDLPINGRQWDALETLAEAARRSDLTGINQHLEQGHGANGTPEPSRSGEPVQLQIQEGFTVNNPPPGFDGASQKDKDAKRGNRNVMNRGNNSSVSQSNYSHILPSGSTSPNLGAIAAAAAASFTPSMVDPQLLEEGSSTHHNPPEKTMEEELQEANSSMNFYNEVPREQAAWPMIDGATGSSPYHEQDHSQEMVNALTNSQQPSIYPPIAMNTQFTEELGNGQKTPKPKSRARFGAERRKEVQNIRRMGACIRCRMLKKTCSDGQPCKPCSSVESARVWKQGCVRTRLGDELDLYASRLHAVLAHQRIEPYLKSLKLHPSTSQIEARHYSDIPIFATFNALEAPFSSGSSSDPNLIGDNTVYKIIDHAKDDLPGKVETYTKAILDVFIEREISVFMKETLKAAKAEIAAKGESDNLLGGVIDLWVTVEEFANPSLHWVVNERVVGSDTKPGEGPSIPSDTTSEVYAAISLQLNAGAEKKATDLCKASLSLIERKLLQPKSNHSFEIYLATLILFTCFEKSAWLFTFWQQEAFRDGWPLDKPQSHYITQAEKVVDMLQSLLKIRHIPPQVYVDENGSLASKGCQEAQEYFQKINISAAYVQSQQDRSDFDQNNYRSFELRFCSKLLLPQS